MLDLAEKASQASGIERVQRRALNVDDRGKSTRGFVGSKARNLISW